MPSDSTEKVAFTQPTFSTQEETDSNYVSSLAHTHSHYHSKLYTSVVGVNPLIAAASPLLSLMGRLKSAAQFTDISELYLDLIHEIKSFESYAQRLNYRPETVLIARYILTATLDETILETDWGRENNWEKHKLLLFFQQEEWGGERFFVILERLEEEPALYIDVLELVYMCLSLGYEGKFRYQERGHLTLSDLLQDLFYKIYQVRRELKPDLNGKKPLLLPKLAPTQTINVLIPVKLFCLSALFSLAVVGSSFTQQQWQHLNPLATPLTHENANSHLVSHEVTT
ncbi:MAG: DotU family type IV/VI secretion system protein [Gammaproteobacteria bacterium]|nr:DotU family type IV/VI secretion system protein [Gammaproteobacteria bacterium]